MTRTTHYTLPAPGSVIPGTVADMLKRNHLLIAGTSGAGKSTLMRSLIHHLLAYSPSQKAMVLLDPKKVDLYQYRNLPHTYSHADTIEGCIASLREMRSVILKRYEMMQAQGLTLWPGGDVYIIVDELADLMTTARKDVLPLLQSIGQIGRAAKVHLWCATQCPIVKVIPTELKVNFDGIVGLRTRSAQDSRNILGENGCECLPMYGQMIYHTPSLMDNYHTITPYVSDDTIGNRITFWNAQNQRKGLFSRRYRVSMYGVL